MTLSQNPDNRKLNGGQEEDPTPSAKEEAKLLQHDVRSDSNSGTAKDTETNTSEENSAHMGATEDQVIPMTPPTDALEALSDRPADPEDAQDTIAANNELTPG